MNNNRSSQLDFLIGTGIHDITGPAAEVGMMGYSMPHQKTAGIHMRLRSRAFIIALHDRSKYVAIVSADLGMIFQGVKQQVIKKLKANAELSDLYDDENVLLSANHTHSGPGGYSHYSLYNLSILGFDKVNFECIVDGIYESIFKAHKNLSEGSIFINKGELKNAGINRSIEAYNLNPQEERDLYKNDTYNDTNKEMVLLKFVTKDGDEIGMLNWFAVHSTNLGNTNKLISGDNKGYASYLFEQSKRTDYMADKTFVAAFAQAEAGDVTPNIWGYPNGTDDFKRMETIGLRQYNVARSLYKSANEKLMVNLDYRHVYLDLSKVSIDSKWVNGDNDIHTCDPAIGFSKLSGSTEDGIGVEFIPEGMTFDEVTFPPFTLVPELQECHKEKRILIPTGDKEPFYFTQVKLPLQIMIIGQLAMLAVPFECTTMAARRLKKSVTDGFSAVGVEHIVIAGYANAYAGYVTTREEYAAQHYEGASTHFGPYTLNAYQQKFNEMAKSLENGEPMDSGPVPPDLSDKQKIHPIGVLFDLEPPGKNFGDIHTNAQPAYSKGQTVKVVFWGGHPRNDLKIQETYLKVECKSGNEWISIAYDWDPETKYKWERSGIAFSKITIEWTIPEKVGTGEYRIRHFRHSKSFWSGDIEPYNGTSRSFTISE